MEADTKELHLSQERYVAVLKRQRARIEAGLALNYYDDTTTGSKNTYCSWGLCSDDKEAWPDAGDHLWPEEFTERGRVAPKYQVDGQLCPFDTDKTPPGHIRSPGDPSGCFYRCRFFQRGRLGPAPDKKRALELYDERLAAASAVQGKTVQGGK